MDDRGLSSSHEEYLSLTPSNLSTILHSDALAASGTPLVEHGGELEVTLRDFIITCFPQDPALHGLEIVVYGLSKEDTVYTEEISPTTWRYHREIQLNSGMDELVLSAESEDSEADKIGYVTFSKHELAVFMAIDHNTEVERDFVMLDENGPSLRLRCTLGASQKADIAHAISTQKSNVDLTSEWHADIALWYENVGFSFVIRFERTGNLEDISRGISSQQRAVDLTPEGDTEMASRLSDLGFFLWTRFKRVGNLADINLAIFTQQRAIQLTPQVHPETPSYLHGLGVSFSARFNHTGDLVDLESAISYKQSAVNLTPEGHTSLPLWLSDLGISFLSRFKYAGDLADIQLSISTQQRAVLLTPEWHPAMPSHLNNLGVSLSARFNYTGDIVDLESAISNQQRAIDLTPERHTSLPSWLSNLGISFGRRFERTSDLADIERAISKGQRSIQLTPQGHPEMPSRLNNLGASFLARFNRTGDVVDLENAISNQQSAVNLAPEEHISLPLWLSNLGISFGVRFRHAGDLVDIERAISNNQRSIQLTPQGHPNMPSRLNGLGVCLLERFNYTGDLTDLESAISNQQRAVELTPEGYTALPSLLNNLGIYFGTRFERTADVADIEREIFTQKRAIQLTPQQDVNMPSRLNNLGVSFLARFDHAGDLADIESAVSNHHSAVDLTPEGHTFLPWLLSNLGTCFFKRFNRTIDLADLENAISAQQMAIQLTPYGHPKMPSRLNSLGNSFSARFNCTGDLVDLESAISNKQRAIDLTPEGHVDNSLFFISLADSLSYRFTRANNIKDIHATMSMLRHSATQVIGHPSIRLNAACNWAEYSHVHDKSQSLDAYSVAIQLLPQVAGLEQTIPKRHKTLIDASNVTSSAAAAAIDDGALETALAWLEQGRCLVWNQINHLRTPADDLRAYDPSLANRFLHVARALEVAGSRQERHSTFLEENMTEMISVQEDVHMHVHLAKEWNKVLQEIRCIPEFQDFLQPPQVAKIFSRLPPDGHVVIFNIHEDRCDALALKSGLDSLIHIPLNTFSLQLAIQLADDLRQYLKALHVRQLQPEAGRDGSRWHPQGPEGAVMSKVLHELWEHVAKPIIDALDYSPHYSNLPRIWWCPTGPLAFLPIHAAGIYGKEGAPAGPCVSDYVVSSYTPTVTDLLDKINAIPTTDDKLTSHLIISQSEPPKSSPGLSPLSGAKEETHALKDMIGPPSKPLLLENASATVSRVKEEMKTHSWVHFACHAIQDRAEPLKSGVQLHDGRLEVLEMMKQTLPHADLAFLSACQTSTGDEKLADEVVHLAAAMLATGYRSVVATMWSIKDKYGPVIAKDFYEHILAAAENSADGRLDSTNAAHALHYATQKIRKELGNTAEALLAWVPYVHFGV